MNIPLKVDYCAMSFPYNTFSPDDVNDMLVGDEVNLFTPIGKKNDVGIIENPTFYTSEHGVTIQPDNGNRVNDLRESIRFSGAGCDKFQRFFPYLYQHYAPNISRLDFAFDVDMSIIEWSRYLETAWYQLKDGEPKQRKKISIVLGSGGDDSTVYIGNRRSAYFFRVYNKTLQLHEKPENGKYKIRFEVEIKRKSLTRNGERVLYNPNKFFELYYFDKFDELTEELKSLWLSFGEDWLLPEWFNKTFYFVASGGVFLLPDADSNSLLVTKKELAESVQDYERTSNYHFYQDAKYVMGWLLDQNKIKLIKQAFKDLHGFEIDFDIQIYYECIDEINKFELEDPPDSFVQLKM